jgi:phosphoesterase RecJ-like protein
MATLDKALDLLRSHRKFILTTHISSDGDGVGSQLALARGLKKLGMEVHVINPTPVPDNLRFLLKSDDEVTVIQDIRDPEEFFRDAFTVILDMGAFDRIASVLPHARESLGILVIDHHPMDPAEGIHYMVDTAVSATGEVTARILRELGVPMSIDLAVPLYTAIQTDTGGFRYEGTRPETHRLAAELLEAGVDPQRIYTEIYERQSLTRLRLTGEILSTLKLSPEGKVASIELRQETLAKVGAALEEGDDLVNYTLLVEGVVAGFYFKELEAGKTKVSCRSRGNFAINEFVGQWGGGGHQHAAGVRLELSLEESKKLILGHVLERLEREPR